MLRKLSLLSRLSLILCPMPLWLECFLHFSRSSPAPCPLVCSIACFDYAVHFNNSNNKNSEESYSCLMRRNDKLLLTNTDCSPVPVCLLGFLRIHVGGPINAVTTILSFMLWFPKCHSHPTSQMLHCSILKAEIWKNLQTKKCYFSELVLWYSTY